MAAPVVPSLGVGGIVAAAETHGQTNGNNGRDLRGVLTGAGHDIRPNPLGGGNTRASPAVGPGGGEELRDKPVGDNGQVGPPLALDDFQSSLRMWYVDDTHIFQNIMLY